MTKANAFQTLGAVAVDVLARLAAKKAVQAELRNSGNRALVPHREIVQQTKAYLAEHPELHEQAFAQAWQMSIDAHAERINAVLFDDDRRVWPKPRPPVYESDHDKSTIEKTQENLQPVSD
jgi:hypothetical protein